MHVPEQPSQELADLIARVIDGGLSSVDSERLNRLLKDDPKAREFYLARLSVHAQLDATAYQGIAPDLWTTPALAPEPMWGRASSLVRAWWREALLVAAALALLANVIPFFRRLTVPAPLNGGSREFVATLVGGQDCEWSPETRLQLGERLARGTIRLNRGHALINFDGGARLVLMAPAELAIDSAGSARLVRGRIAAHAPEEAIGFRVITPQGTVVDLGTEFVVGVGADGKTECDVLSGAVQWQPKGGDRRIALLKVGNARRFEQGHSEVIASSARRYEDFVPATSRDAAARQLLAYEPFDYAATRAPAGTLDGGTGWTSPWRGRYVPSDTVDQDPQMQLRPGENLSIAGLQPAQGGHFVFDGGGQWRLRRLPKPIDFGSDGIYYVSFLVRRPDFVRNPGADNPLGRLVMNFRSETDYWSHWIGFAISSANEPFIIADGDNRGSSRLIDTSRPCLVVCKITTSRDQSDQLFMKIYEQGDKIEPDETARWTIVSRPLQLDVAMDLLIPSVNEEGGSRWELDEIRYGTSWAAVTPLGTEVPAISVAAGPGTRATSTPPRLATW
jgi:ferric-dicitrate binding protein FerR (iron transport regulator)